MKIAILGAGSLGRSYGVRLASSANDVVFIVRHERHDNTPFVIEQVNASNRRHTLEHPSQQTQIPQDCEIIAVTVHFQHLIQGLTGSTSDSNSTVVSVLRKGPDVPVVLFTPVMPVQLAKLAQAINQPLVAVMPGIAGYIDEQQVTRYWIPTSATTLIDVIDKAEPRYRDAIGNFTRALTTAGFPVKAEQGVAAQNAATTTAFFPLTAAIDIAGTIDGVLSNKALLSTTLDAAKECSNLAEEFGKVAPWAHLLTKFIGRFTLKPGIALARRLYPESVEFVEHHFGRKLHEQYVSMGAAILAMGRERNQSMPEFERMMGMLRDVRP